jgi:hypothetical protein
LNFKTTSDAQLVLLILFAITLLARHRFAWLERGRHAILAVLACASLAAYLNFGEMHRHFGASQPYEFYHYYVGTKYYAELGHTGLYEATVVADFEDDRAGFAGDRSVRELRTYGFESRWTVVARSEEVKRPFSAERWKEFKRDITYFRGRGPALWRSSRVQYDHGYNGTPLVTAILGGLASLPIPVDVFVSVFAWLDLAIILGLGLAIGRFAGPTAGWLFVFLWAVNPWNPYGFIGGAYLRYLYFATLGASVVCFERRHLVASGALAAVSCLIALFPAVLVAAMLVRDLLRPDRGSALRAHTPFYASLVGTGAVLLLATSAIPSPGGANPWLAFRDAISIHSGELSHNHVGLKSVFSYHPDHDLEGIERRLPSGQSRSWRNEGAATLESRAIFYRITQGLLVLAILVFLRSASPLGAWFGGLVALYTFVPLSHYYYTVLSLVPFLFDRDDRSLIWLSGFWVIVTLLRQIDALENVLDRLLFTASVFALIYFGAAMAPAIVRTLRARAV